MHLFFDLQLFADGAGGPAGGDGAAAAPSGETAAAAGQQKGKANPLANVSYGIQAEPQQAEETQEKTSTEAAQPPEESFEDLIKGKYKDEFGKRVQDILDHRLKDYKTLQEQQQKSAGLMEFLQKQTGKEAGDFEGILQDLMDRDAVFEDAAMKAGKTTEEYKAEMKSELERSEFKRQNDALQAELEMRRRQEADAEAARRWQQEVEAVQQVYDNFDIQQEMQNQKFVDCMRKGLPMRTAFEVTHMDELMSGAMRYTAQKVTEQVTNGIRAKSSRPVENGLSNKAAVHDVRADVTKLSKADRDEIARRIQRGEKISFG